jgi:hypothetical protein
MFVMAIRTSHRSCETFEQEFRQVRWQPCKPVRRQLAAILKAAKRKRRYAGYLQVSPSAFPTMRHIANVFAEAASIPAPSA